MCSQKLWHEHVRDGGCVHGGPHRPCVLKIDKWWHRLDGGCLSSGNHVSKMLPVQETLGSFGLLLCGFKYFIETPLPCSDAINSLLPLGRGILYPQRFLWFIGSLPCSLLLSSNINFLERSSLNTHTQDFPPPLLPPLLLTVLHPSLLFVLNVPVCQVMCTGQVCVIQCDFSPLAVARGW